MNTHQYPTIAILAIFVFLGISVNAQRTMVDINANWRFLKGDHADYYLQHHGSMVNLPHCWNIEDTMDDTPGYFRGIGTYYKELNINSIDDDSNYFLKFEAISQTAEIIVNGRFAGRHAGGYTSFFIDISKLIKTGSNKILVKVDNSINLHLPPISGDFNIFGGIYRDVWLIKVPKVHFNLSSMGHNGILISQTHDFKNNTATLTIRTELGNSSETTNKVIVKNTITDNNGTIIANEIKKISCNPQAVTEAKSQITLHYPELWSPDSPYLYSLKTELYKGNELIDYQHNKIGFRWYSFDKDKGFFLNGRPLKLIGACLHQDQPEYGYAVPKEQLVRDIEGLKTIGFNFVRLSHYPHNQVTLDACDKLGLIVWSEVPLVNEIHPSKEFETNALNMTEEMIKQNFNHTSVMIWGYMNEIYATRELKWLNKDSLISKTVELAKKIENLINSIDTERYTAIAFESTFTDDYFHSGLTEIPKICAWNLYFGWYNKTTKDFAAFIDKAHQRHPDKPMLISEYGYGSDLRIQTSNPIPKDFSTEGQMNFHSDYIKAIIDRPYIAGSSLWNAYDFAAEHRGDGIPHLNNKGIFTYDRKPKDVAYLYKALLSNQPFVKIAGFNSTERKYGETAKGSVTATQKVKTYSNQKEINLSHNGKAIGTKTVVDGSAEWLIPFAQGENTLVATCENDISDQLRITCSIIPFDLSQLEWPDIAINLGATFNYTDQRGIIWLAEREYTIGSYGIVTNEDRPSNIINWGHNFIATKDDVLYSIHRKNLKTIQFDVIDGTYEIELHLLEPYCNQSFNIYLNEGLSYIHQPSSSAETPYKQTSIIEVKDGKGVNISFSPDKPNMLAAIRVKRIY